MRAIFFCCLLMGVFFLESVFAATDGTLGNPSTGTADISLSVPKLIIIRGMADMILGPYSGTGILEANENIAISTNIRSSTRTYRVTATGSCVGNSPANAFNTSDGTFLVPYSVAFNDVTGTAGEVGLTAGVSLGGQTGGNFPLAITADNANYHVGFSQANLQAASSGNYTGTLSLVVAPE